MLDLVHLSIFLSAWFTPGLTDAKGLQQHFFATNAGDVLSIAGFPRVTSILFLSVVTLSEQNGLSPKGNRK